MDGTYYRHREEGLIYKIDNGGVKAGLPRTAWAMIVAAVITGIFELATVFA